MDSADTSRERKEIIIARLLDRLIGEQDQIGREIGSLRRQINELIRNISEKESLISSLKDEGTARFEYLSQCKMNPTLSHQRQIQRLKTQITILGTELEVQKGLLLEFKHRLMKAQVRLLQMAEKLESITMNIARLTEYGENFMKTIERMEGINEEAIIETIRKSTTRLHAPKERVK